jgi:hypothetical protein
MHARIAAILLDAGKHEQSARHAELSLEARRRHCEAQAALLQQLQTQLAGLPNQPG